MNGKSFLLSLLLLFIVGDLAAQEQPPQAVNQQDEIINIPITRGEGTEDPIEILRSDDKFETNDYITEAIEVFNLEAYEMKQVILGAVQQERGTVRTARTKAPDGSSRYFLVVTTTPKQMPSIRETIQKLDLPGFINSQGDVRVAVRTKYRQASELGALLKATRLSSLSDVVADDATNTLYYDDSDYVINGAKDYLAFYDVPIPQIEFDVQIIEVRQDEIGKIGLDWDAWKRTVGGQFGLTTNSFEGGDGFWRLDSLLTLDASVLASFLNYTVQEGHANVVQRSRLNASNLEPAVISDFRRVPYYDYERSERLPLKVTEENPRVDTREEYDDDEIPSGIERTVTIVPPVTNSLVDLTSEQEGLLISIAPIITTESVLAKIDIALNTVTGFDQFDKPVITEQNLANRFTLQNREEILLGTLERKRAVTARRGIPGLKDIPVLKTLFSSETKRTEVSRLFILATPHFSNTSFAAKSIDELKTMEPLHHETREVILDDGKLASLPR